MTEDELRALAKYCLKGYCIFWSIVISLATVVYTVLHIT